MSDEVDGAVSPALRRTVSELGPEAERWLAEVPALISKVSAAWKLQVGRALVHGGCASLILPVTTDRDVPAVLKLSVPHDGSRYEADALERWGGDGAVSVLRSSTDGFTLLVERCEPGHDLWTVAISEQIACSMATSTLGTSSLHAGAPGWRSTRNRSSAILPSILPRSWPTGCSSTSVRTAAPQPRSDTTPGTWPSGCHSTSTPCCGGPRSRRSAGASGATRPWSWTKLPAAPDTAMPLFSGKPKTCRLGPRGRPVRHVGHWLGTMVPWTRAWCRTC